MDFNHRRLRARAGSSSSAIGTSGRLIQCDTFPRGARKTGKLTAFGHSNHEALVETATLARGPVLLVDDTLAIVFAFAQRGQVVVCAPEEGLQ